MKELVKTIDGNNSTDDIMYIEGLKRSLLACESDFKQLFKKSHLPQWIYNSDSLQVIMVNDAAVKQYGYLEEEFKSMTIREMVPQEEVQRVILYNEFIKTTSEPFTFVSPQLKKNSERVLAETTYVNFIYKEQPCVLVTAVDLTEKIKLEEKIILLKVARQQKITLATINGQEKERDFISQELHDNINQLLTAAKLYMEFARIDEDSRVASIGRAEDLLVKAISEIRILSTSLAPPVLRDISFKDSLTELFESYLATHAFSIQLLFDDTMNNLDQEIQITLFRIVQEQINNIQKHAQANKIIVSLHFTDHICLSISDDGIGFDTSIKRRGLGITNTKNRVSLYNGTMDIISKPQEGCTLIIHLPYKMHSPIKPCSTVLIVEDDPDDQEIITRAFREIDPHYKVTCLNDGKMLIDHLQSLQDINFPCLIVLDYNMPLLNGLETLQALELDKRLNKIPKIIYSSSSMNYIKNLFSSANAKAYITKGLTLEEIKDNVQEMLSFVNSTLSD